MTNAERSRQGVSGNAKLRTKAPVNVGRNYNGPKVAKFLVGQVPTCTNRVTNAGENAGYPQKDGKTP